jgi:tetrahydromethanopterin S-methyltransferase subunit F
MGLRLGLTGRDERLDCGVGGLEVVGVVEGDAEE